MPKRYEVTFPMREGPDARMVVSATYLNTLLRVWSDLVESDRVPSGLVVEVQTLDASDGRPSQSLRELVQAFVPALRVLDGTSR